MEEKTKWAIIIFCLVVSVVIGGLSWFSLQNKPQTVWNVPSLVVPEGTLLFYGSTCPHCKHVEEYITENNITSRIRIVQKEVYENETNAQEMAKWANACGIRNSIGVPFMVTSGACYLGEDECIKVLKNKTSG